MNVSKLTTSKQLAWVIVIFYIVAFFSIEFLKVKYNTDLFELFNSTLPLPMTVILSYFGKSGIENYYKIKSGLGTDSAATTETAATVDTTSSTN